MVSFSKVITWLVVNACQLGNKKNVLAFLRKHNKKGKDFKNARGIINFIKSTKGDFIPNGICHFCHHTLRIRIQDEDGENEPLDTRWNYYHKACLRFLKQWQRQIEIEMGRL